MQATGREIVRQPYPKLRKQSSASTHQCPFLFCCTFDATEWSVAPSRVAGRGEITQELSTISLLTAMYFPNRRHLQCEPARGVLTTGCEYGHRQCLNSEVNVSPREAFQLCAPVVGWDGENTRLACLFNLRAVRCLQNLRQALPTAKERENPAIKERE